MARYSSHVVNKECFISNYASPMDTKLNRVEAYDIRPPATKSCLPTIKQNFFLKNGKHYFYNSVMRMTTRLDRAVASGKVLINKVT